jgi:hypothetical protein
MTRKRRKPGISGLSLSGDALLGLPFVKELLAFYLVLQPQKKSPSLGRIDR